MQSDFVPDSRLQVVRLSGNFDAAPLLGANDGDELGSLVEPPSIRTAPQTVTTATPAEPASSTAALRADGDGGAAVASDPAHAHAPAPVPELEADPFQELADRRSNR